MALAPLVGLVAEAFALDRFGRVRFDMFLSLACDGGVFCALFHSLILGFVAAAVAFVFGWGIGPPRRRVSWRHPTSWPRVLPPLVLGLGALLLPGLLDSVALRFGGPFSRIFHDLADFADVYRSPWTILVLCGAVFQVPMLSSAFEKARLMTSDDQREVARTLGASRFWAWVTAAAPGALAIFVGVFSTAISAAAIASMPNILLSRTMAAKPVAPEIIELLSEPSGMRKAAGLACLSLLFPIASWVVCKAGIRRSGRTRLVRR